MVLGRYLVFEYLDKEKIQSPSTSCTKGRSVEISKDEVLKAMAGIGFGISYLCKGDIQALKYPYGDHFLVEVCHVGVHGP